jgi:hypothetical protein
MFAYIQLVHAYLLFLAGRRRITAWRPIPRAQQTQRDIQRGKDLRPGVRPLRCRDPGESQSPDEMRLCGALIGRTEGLVLRASTTIFF